MVVSRSGVVDLKSVFKKQSHDDDDVSIDKGFEFQSIQFIGSLWRTIAAASEFPFRRKWFLR